MMLPHTVPAFLESLKAGGEVSALVRQEARTDVPGLEIAGGIAMIGVRGVIGRGLPWYAETYFGMRDLCNVEAALMECIVAEDVHTVILDISSPGGQARGTHEAAVLVRDVAAAGKRVISWIDTVGASAGYYIAAGANEIYAMPTAAVGSIGCKLALIDSAGMWQADGLVNESVSSAPGKLRGQEGTPFSDADRAFFQGTVEDLGGMFAQFVAERRPVTAAALSGDYGSAGSWGMANGLIDGVFPTFAHLYSSLVAK